MKETRDSDGRQRRRPAESLAQHLKRCDACRGGRPCDAGKKLKRAK